MLNNNYLLFNKTKSFIAQATGAYQTVTERYTGITAGKEYTLLFENVENNASNVVATLDFYNGSNTRLLQVLVYADEKFGTAVAPAGTSYISLNYRLSFDTPITA